MKKIFILFLMLTSCATNIKDIRIISQSELLSSQTDATLSNDQNKVSFIQELLEKGFEAVSNKDNEVLPFSKVETVDDLVCILYYGPKFISISNPSKKRLKNVNVSKDLGVVTISVRNITISPESTVYTLAKIDLNKGYKLRDLCRLK